MKNILTNQTQIENETSLLVELSNSFSESKIQRAVIVPRGEHPHPRGVQVIDDAAIERIIDRVTERGIDIVVDYNHASFDNSSPEDRRAAGWIKFNTFIATANGVEADIEWTPAAKELLENREYRYLSPVFETDLKKATNGKSFIKMLVNVALTNNPNIAGMPALTNAKTGETKMDPKILAALGLDPEATLENALTKINELATLAKADSEKEVMLNSLFADLGATDVTDASRKITLLQKPPAHSDDDYKLLNERLAGLENADLTTLLANAIEEGKIAASQKAWAEGLITTNPSMLREVIANAIVVIPAGDPKASATPPAGGPVTLTAEETALVKNMISVTEEDLLAVKKEEAAQANAG